ncbi:helix-turn-helix transcriptional regulator [Ralstonia pseudosolanacearum]|nr:helix-turn-helix transcriptional regulator [Ralstonia pseudosolanacearum]
MPRARPGSTACLRRLPRRLPESHPGTVRRSDRPTAISCIYRLKAINYKYRLGVISMESLLSSAPQLSAHLKSLRKARGLTQAQLGALLGVSQNRIADIEKDPGAVGFEQLLRILHALGAQLTLRTSAPPPPRRRLVSHGASRTASVDERRACRHLDRQPRRRADPAL